MLGETVRRHNMAPDLARSLERFPSSASFSPASGSCCAATYTQTGNRGMLPLVYGSPIAVSDQNTRPILLSSESHHNGDIILDTSPALGQG